MFDHFHEGDKSRAARHEAGHWLAYKRFGFRAGPITVDAEERTYSASVEADHPTDQAPVAVRIDYLKNRMRTVLAGFVGQAIPRADNVELAYVNPTEWKRYREFAHDYDRFQTLANQLVKLEPVSEANEIVQYFFTQLQPDVYKFLAQASPALDAIQDLIHSSGSRTFEPQELDALPEVAAVFASIDGSAPPAPPPATSDRSA